MGRIIYRFIFLLLFCLFCTSAFSQSNKIIDSLLSVIKTAKEDTGKVNTLNALSSRLLRTDKYVDARKYADNALALGKKLNFGKGIGNAYNTIGNIFGIQGNYPEALKNHFVSLKIRVETGDGEGIAASYNNIGLVYMYQGNNPEALKYYLASLKFFEDFGNKNGIATSTINIGGIYWSQGNYPEALKYFLAALKTFEEIGNKQSIANSYSNIGSIYDKQGNLSEALKNYMTALKIYEEIGNKIGIAAVNNNIGTLYDNQGNYPEALKNHLASLKIKEEIGDKRGITASYINLGGVNNKLNKPAIAKKYFDSALSISKEIGAKDQIREAYKFLAKLDSSQNNFKSAYENHKMYILYRDSILNKENTEKIVRQQMQYDFDKKEDSLKYQQALTNEQLKQQTLLTQQQQQSLLLKEKELRLSNTEKELQRLAYLKTQSDLEAEQSRRKENENQLIISEQEKTLQKTKLNLQTSQLGLQTKELQAKKTQRNISMAGAIALMILAFFIYRNFQSKQKLNKLYKVDAEKKMTELQLQSLRAQLNPHFMFNSLNAIQELIVMEENEKSQSYLERFAQLLRQLLDNANQPFIPLRKEINFLELYLSLESLRLPDLKYSITIDPEVKAENITIPNMMLQPYIENALWHGLQHKQGEKKLHLHISRQNGSVQFEIKDNGVGRKKAEELKSLYRKEHRSKGMELLSQRFDLLSQEYGQNIQTKVTDLVENGDAAGTLVMITVPASLSEKLFKNEETE